MLDLYAYFFQKWVHIEETDETKYMSFLMKDKELVARNNEIWEIVTNSIKKEFNSEPGYNEKYLKAKMKSCNGILIKFFTGIKYQKKDSQVTYLSVILIESVFRTDKNYYP